MASSTAVLFGILCCVVLVQGWKECTTQEDCVHLIECCSKHILSNKAYCIPTRAPNEMCMENLQKVNQTYDVTCPCGAGLLCYKDSYFRPSGELLFSRIPRCRPFSYKPPPLRESNGNYVSSVVVAQGPKGYREFVEFGQD